MRDEQAHTLMALLAALPREVERADITDVALLEERIAAVGALHANTIGVGEEGVQFCPDNEPPLLEEKLMWLWVIHTPLGATILAFPITFPISAACQLLLTAYLHDDMSRFWDHMSQPE